MGKYLDLDDVAATSELASKELSELREENARLSVEVARQHEEILHLRIFAPGRHKPRVIKTIPRVGPTDWRFYGLELAESDFDAFGHTVPNESEL